MNPTSQLDLHPDAESLNAFVEQALPEREHGQILAHLAGCSRCRQVIFVAQQAVSALEPAANTDVSTDSSTIRTGSWLRGWRWAWVPAAALASILALAVFVHLRHAGPAPELARVAPPAAPQNVGTVAAPSPQERAGSGTATVSAGAAKSSERKVRSAPARATFASPAPDAILSNAPPGQAGAFEMSNAELHGAALPPSAPGQGVAAVQLKPGPAFAALQPQPVAGALSSNATAAKTTQARMDSMAERLQTSRTTPAKASVAQSQIELAPGSNSELAAQQQRPGVIAARKAKTTVLPSGLTALSTVTAQHRTLAIDMAGALFLSEDSGRHWESVARQWSGRAVEVRVQRDLNANAAGASALASAGAEHESNGLSAGAAVAPPLPAAVFEIVTDSDLIWVSTDGKTWKAK
jgi:hypothetical protein